MSYNLKRNRKKIFSDIFGISITYADRIKLSIYEFLILKSRNISVIILNDSYTELQFEIEISLHNQLR